MKTFFKTLFAILLAIVTSVVILFVAVAVLIYGAVGFVTPAIEAPQRGTVLEVNLSQEITDSPRMLPLINLNKLSLETGQSLSLLAALKALEAASADPNITALSLRLDGEYQLPLTLAEELRNAVARFKTESGKPIYAYSQSYSQTNYYLASVADSLYIEPLGNVEWKGVATSNFYFGDFLREMGIGVEAFRPAACEFKSAVEPYTLGGESKESREQSQRLVDELWRGIVGQVATARKMNPKSLKSIAAEEVILGSSEAQQSGMIDEIAYADEYEAVLERCGVVRNSEKELRKISLGDYSLLQQNVGGEMNSSSAIFSNKVAIIYADGVIMDGVSEGGNDPIVGSETLSRLLRKAAQDEDIKAVVLRVNSPGGSALAADVMWREVELLREQKPVIVSMGSSAASGGYYISAPADIIVADRYTLTGSIGVYSLLFSYDRALSNTLGINIEGAKSEPSADFGRTPRALNKTERRAMMRGVDSVYDTFTGLVAEGRNLPIGVVSTLAGGRVWSGVEAEACGLIDAIGGLHKALSLAIDRSSLAAGEYEVVELMDETDGVEMLKSAIGVELRSLFGDGDMSRAMVRLKRVERISDGDYVMYDAMNLQ